jgi:hypothetical protein
VVKRFALSPSAVVGNHHRIRVQLEPGINLSGRVIDESGKPVEGAQVIASPRPDAPTTDAVALVGPATTDHDGEFRYCVTTGQWFVNAMYEGYQPAVSQRLDVDAGARDISVPPLVLKRGGELSGIVVDKTGNPVSGAYVVASPGGESGVIKRVQADGRGEFHLVGLPSQKMRLTASSNEASSSPTDLDLTNETTKTGVLLTLTDDGSISGVVIDHDGAPIAGAQILCVGVLTGRDDRIVWSVSAPVPMVEVSDSKGVFNFRGLNRSIQIGCGSSPPEQFQQV